MFSILAEHLRNGGPVPVDPMDSVEVLDIIERAVAQLDDSPPFPVDPAGAGQ